MAAIASLINTQMNNSIHKHTVNRKVISIAIIKQEEQADKHIQ